MDDLETVNDAGEGGPEFTTAVPTYATREAWLDAATSTFKRSVEHATACQLPPVKVSCGFPARKALARKNRAIGECWGPEATRSELAHLYISPLIDDPVEVLAVLVHELTHAALPAKVKHGRAFHIAVKKLGLEGKPTATTPSQLFAETMRDKVIPALGLYPHVKFEPPIRATKQGTRNLLYACDCKKVRHAGRELRAKCLDCGVEFVLQESLVE